MRICPSCRSVFEASAQTCPKDGLTLIDYSITFPRATAGSDSAPTISGTPSVIQAGMMIGDYRVEGVIAQGGMGVIYEGIHPVISKRVAIKILNRRYAKDSEEISRFVLEARAVNQIGHHNIVDIFAIGELNDGRNYLVMECLEGLELHRVLARVRRFEPGEILPLYEQLCDALSAAHAKGFVHRDLKPENITVLRRPPYPFIKILDFGIAKLRGAEHTAVGTVLGTPEYMAPEQCRAGHIDGRVDIYSLGVMLYELLTGCKPFTDKDPLRLLAKHSYSEPIPPSQLAPMSRDLEAVVLKAMAKSPNDRFQSATELIEQLRRAIPQPLPWKVDLDPKRPDCPQRKKAAPKPDPSDLALEATRPSGPPAHASLLLTGPATASASGRDDPTHVDPFRRPARRRAEDGALARPGKQSTTDRGFGPLETPAYDTPTLATSDMVEQTVIDHFAPAETKAPEVRLDPLQQAARLEAERETDEHPKVDQVPTAEDEQLARGFFSYVGPTSGDRSTTEEDDMDSEPTTARPAPRRARAVERHTTPTTVDAALRMADSASEMPFATLPHDLSALFKQTTPVAPEPDLQPKSVQPKEASNKRGGRRVAKTWLEGAPQLQTKELPRPEGIASDPTRKQTSGGALAVTKSDSDSDNAPMSTLPQSEKEGKRRANGGRAAAPRPRLGEQGADLTQPPVGIDRLQVGDTQPIEQPGQAGKRRPSVSEATTLPFSPPPTDARGESFVPDEGTYHIRSQISWNKRPRMAGVTLAIAVAMGIALLAGALLLL